MPVLHKYRKKDGHYILAGISGSIVTYRLSVEGTQRLINQNINDGDKLSWPMLLDFIRQGDAYKSNSGTNDEDLSGWTQLGLLFNVTDNEPSSSDLVPLCTCGSMENLHIVELSQSKTASLVCQECRKSSHGQIDASVPIYLINTPIALDHLLDRSGLEPDDSVIKYSELLNSTLAAKWQSRILPKGKSLQVGLFQEPKEEQQSLL